MKINEAPAGLQPAPDQLTPDDWWRFLRFNEARVLKNVLGPSEHNRASGTLYGPNLRPARSHRRRFDPVRLQRRTLSPRKHEEAGAHA